MKKYCSNCGFGNQYEVTPPSTCAKCKKGMAKIELPKNLVTPSTTQSTYDTAAFSKPIVETPKDVKLKVEIDLEKRESLPFSEIASQPKTNSNRPRQKLKKAKISDEDFFSEIRQSMKVKDIEIGE